MNHYEWLENNLETFFNNIGIELSCPSGLITAHGDKAYSYETKWNKHGIYFYHGIAIYLLTYMPQFSKEVRETKNGWVAPDQWVIDNYERFKPYLPEGIK